MVLPFSSIIFRDPSTRILWGSRKSQRSEIFGKRSGRRNGQDGKRSAPSAMVPCRDELRMTEEVRVRRLAPHPVTLSGAAKAQPKPRSRTGLLHSPLCHFDRGKKQPRLTEWRNLARKRYGKQTSSFFMPSPFLRGKGDRIYRVPKKYRRTFWEEERQAQQARRQA